MSDNTAYAYDPVHNEDVKITCRRDTPHDFDITRAVREEQRGRWGDQETAKDHPRLLSADFDHDPVEACQGSSTWIVDAEDAPVDPDEGCPLCGYDRFDHSVDTMGGVHSFTCRRCGGNYVDNGEFSAPTTAEDHFERMVERSEEIGRVDGQRIYLESHNVENQRGGPRGNIHIEKNHSTGYTSINLRSVESLVKIFRQQGLLDVDFLGDEFAQAGAEQLDDAEKLAAAIPGYAIGAIVVGALDDSAMQRLINDEDDSDD